MDRLIRGTPKSPCGCMNAGWTLPFAGIHVRTGKRLHVQNLTRLWVTLCLRREERKQSKTRRYIPKEPVKRSGLSKMSVCVWELQEVTLFILYHGTYDVYFLVCIDIRLCWVLQTVIFNDLVNCLNQNVERSTLSAICGSVTDLHCFVFIKIVTTICNHLVCLYGWKRKSKNTKS